MRIRNLWSLCMVLIVVAAYAIVGSGQVRQGVSVEQKKALLASLQLLPVKQIPSIDASSAPLHILSASSREVPKPLYREFTGEASALHTMSTYPEVTLVNTSQKTIAEFILMLKVADGTGHAIFMKQQSIQPGATFIIPSAKWPKPERVTVQRNGKFVSAIRQPGLDSPKAWLPGPALDSKLTVGMVTFSDGTTWTAPDDPSW